MANAFERGEVQGLKDDLTVAQLRGILYEIDAHGRIKIESKESARARGLPSPDRAEAPRLAMAKPPAKMEYYSIRDLPNLRAAACASAPDLVHPLGGYRRKPDDPMSDRPVLRRWPRSWDGF